jgi:hypothetical protein
MKKHFFYLIVCFSWLLAAPVLAQSNDFKIYTFPNSWGAEPKEYLKANKAFEFITIFTRSSIVSEKSDTVLSKSAVIRELNKRFPDPNSKGILLLDWEGKIFSNLRKENLNSARFKYSESQYLELIKTVKDNRPQLKVAIYGLPSKIFGEDQKKKALQSYGKLNNILSQVDVIAPSVYISYPDEAISAARNKKFFQDNLDIALAYGKQLNKPVIPLVWHRVHPANKIYSRALIQPEVFGAYVKFISQYSQQNYKVSGVMWWDDLKPKARLKNTNGLGNWTQGKVTDNTTYNNMMIGYADALLTALNK